MAQCKKCGKKGIFLKVNANQLCEDCARPTTREEKIGWTVKARTDSVQFYVSGIVEHVSGLEERDSQTQEQGVELAKEALAIMQKATDLLKEGKLIEFDEYLNSTDSRLTELFDTSLALMVGMPLEGEVNA